VESPKQERRSRNRMRQDEYNRLLSVAGSSHRDYAILTVLLQCGLRVSELCNLTVDDIDLSAGVLLIRDGKGRADRRIALEKKARKALTSHLKDRGEQNSPCSSSIATASR
jgi:integrase/recombinase XerD